MCQVFMTTRCSPVCKSHGSSANDLLNNKVVVSHTRSWFLTEKFSLHPKEPKGSHFFHHHPWKRVAHVLAISPSVFYNFCMHCVLFSAWKCSDLFRMFCCKPQPQVREFLSFSCAIPRPFRWLANRKEHVEHNYSQRPHHVLSVGAKITLYTPPRVNAC